MPNYEQPNGVVKNKLGAVTHEQLERREAQFVDSRIVEIQAGLGSKSNDFGLDRLKAIHGYVFQDVFEFAGCTRHERVLLSDGTIATMPTMARPGSKPFAPSHQIEPRMAALAADIHKADNLRGFDRGAFVDKVTDILAEINAIHAFREGNGRTQREFMRQLGREAGHELDFRGVTRERMMQVSIEANERGDKTMMRRIVEEAADPDRARLLRENLAELKSGFKSSGRDPDVLNDKYIATFQPGRSEIVKFAGAGTAGFMAQDAQSRIMFGDKAHLPSPPPERGETFTFTAPAKAREAEAAPQTRQARPAPTKDELREALDKAERDGASKATIDKARAAYHDSLRPKGRDQDLER